MSRKRRRRPLPAGPSTRTTQAAIEGVAQSPEYVKTVNGEEVPSSLAVQFAGEWYRIRESMGLMPLIKFAFHAERGLDSNDPAGLAALYAMLRDCIHPDEWTVFEYSAMDTCALGDALMAVVSEATTKISAIPSRPPSDSPDGRRQTSASLKDSSSSQDMIPVSDLLGRSSS